MNEFLGYSKEELEELYMEAEAMFFFSIMLENSSASRSWAQRRKELSLTLYTLNVGAAI